MSAEDKPQSETIATLRIDLIDSDPPIWREIEVPLAMTLKQLHGAIQAAMEWEDAHLWEFTLGRERIGSSRAARLTLQDVLRPRITKLGYTYDMGDCWQHQLTLTKPRPADPALAYPRYLAGENPAPPEDCGGIPGFLCATRSPRRSQPPRSRRRKGVLRRLQSEPLRRSAHQRPARPYRQPPAISPSQKQTTVIG
jgi:Plasmid pRiA4b ORF-3-like protein